MSNGEWQDLPKGYKTSSSGTGYTKRNGKGDPTNNVSLADAKRDGCKSWIANGSTTGYNLPAS